MALGAGQRDRKIVIERGAPVRSGLGAEPIVNWQPLCTEWASVRYGTSAERRTAAAEGSSQAATFGLLWNSATSTITTKDRLAMDGQAWDIQGVSLSPRNTGVVIAATIAG